ncbi:MULTISPECIES: hypothetical protein [Bacteroidales]|uniref:Uncharacterized protein n=1 Tax=Prevotella heparinolytica TaxID=28113 RepID=A0A3P2AE68_9BACE|nr:MULTISPECIES: hypothetical protein [Bacteroidales]KGL47529.1 hypothetical protein HQ49_07820 [Porphyromonas gulae]KGL49058.1 hypothetical protein HQ34_06230 [Porphyromonas cangingivalis]RRD92460.1 hypothetical protein EII33_03910 [Bacteroides heparinolyticus]
MAYYTFYQDRKVTCWERTHFEVQADTYEEALAMVKSWNGEDVALWEDEEKVIITEGETLYETTEALSPEDNHGRATIEVFGTSGESITDNANPTKR